MIATVKGHFNGSQIVLDSAVELQKGQEVVVTYNIIQPAGKESAQDALVDSLIGVIPNKEKSLSEYRAERLKKYAAAD